MFPFPLLQVGRRLELTLMLLKKELQLAKLQVRHCCDSLQSASEAPLQNWSLVDGPMSEGAAKVSSLSFVRAAQQGVQFLEGVQRSLDSKLGCSQTLCTATLHSGFSAGVQSAVPMVAVLLRRLCSSLCDRRALPKAWRRRSAVTSGGTCSQSSSRR